MIKNRPPETKDHGIPIRVHDAWGESHDLAKGLADLLFASSANETALNQQGLAALEVVARHLLDRMETVDALFHPVEKGGTA